MALKKFTVFGRKIKAHNAMCADSFRTDRKCGLIYPSYQLIEADGSLGPIVSVEVASVECDFCAYCGTN